MEDMETLPTILDGTYFVVTSRNENKITAQCQLCVNKFIDGYLKPTSNFTTHLKRMHPDRKWEYDVYKTTKGSKRVKQTFLPDDSFNNIVQSTGSVSQDDANNLVFNYIVNSMKPLSTVECPELRKLLNGFNPHLQVLRRYEMAERINSKFNEKQRIIKDQLNAAEFVCLTVDVWSARTVSFFGVTYHIISDELQRVSFALACKRSAEAHSYAKIAKMLTDVMKVYDLSNEKLTGIVTDNGSKFVKASDVFTPDSMDEDINEGIENDDDLIFTDLTDLLQKNENKGQAFFPTYQYYRCSADTFNLICMDANKFSDETSQYVKIYQSSMGKCHNLWNKKSSKAIFSICGRQIPIPDKTMWNSVFDSVVALLEIKDTLESVCQRIGAPMLKPQETDFLEKWRTVFQPLATSLDILQGKVKNEGDIFLAVLGPTVLSTKSKLESFMKQEGHKLLFPLIQALLNGISSSARFGYIVDMDLEDEKFRNVLFAAISHPYFKLRWIPKEKVEQFKNAFIKEARRLQPSSTTFTRLENTLNSNFFEFPSQDTFEGLDYDSVVALECLQYFQSAETDLQILHNFPAVKKVFLKHNTVIPSSEPVKRLLSFESIIKASHNEKLSDEILEKFVILKCS